jgi:hypothetical protein
VLEPEAVGSVAGEVVVGDAGVTSVGASAAITLAVDSSPALTAGAGDDWIPNPTAGAPKVALTGEPDPNPNAGAAVTLLGDTDPEPKAAAGEPNVGLVAAVLAVPNPDPKAGA